jgi:hypothetical protein
MKKILLVSLFSLFITACAGTTPTASPAPVAQETPTVTMTVTPAPTATITLTSTITPSPTPEIPPPVTKEQLAAVTEENFVSNFTVRTEEEFAALNELLLTNPNNINYKNAPSVDVYQTIPGVDQTKLGIEGIVGVNIFPQYLSNVDGELRMSTLVVTKENGVNYLRLIVGYFSTEFESNLWYNTNGLNILGRDTDDIVIEYLLQLWDGVSDTEGALLDGVILKDAWKEIFRIVNING